MKANQETTFGIIKPEALKDEIIKDIKNRINNKNLIITRELKTKMNNEQIKVLYGPIAQKLPKVYNLLNIYLKNNEVILLKIEGKEAIKQLLAIRGSSNAKEACQGTIRGDYAKDQDYEKLRKQNKLALNFFHAADNKEEANLMIQTFFGGKNE